MAAPVDSPEQAFRLRRFAGVNTFIDPVFLGPQFLALSRNWIPSQSFRLAKKPGSRGYAVIDAVTVTDVTSIARFYSHGHRYLYMYGQRATGDGLFRTVDDAGPVAAVATFSSADARGRMIRYGDFVYVGNGVEDLRQVHIETAVTTVLTPITTLTTTPAGTLVATGIVGSDVARTPAGSYEFCWAVYDTTTKLYLSRSDPKTCKVEADQHTTATAPGLLTAPLPGGQVYRLFVAPNGFPIEYATQQGVDHNSGETQVFGAFDVTANRVPSKQNVVRTGNMFTTYRGRVVFAGNQADPMAVSATGVLLPGLEQDAFNQGAFFPAFARIPLPGVVTGLGVSGSTGPQDPRSPLVVFTGTKTFLYVGDPFDPEDQGAAQIQLSDRIGCPAHDTIVPTPIGLVFVGMDSVYLLDSSGGPPTDIGWPIADQIRSIGVSSRSRCVAIYHKFFYKLSIPAPGSGQADIQWWLDLRQGVGDVPSWWGPHTAPPTTAFATALADPDEEDKGFGATAGVIYLHHQTNLYYDMGQPIRSVLRTGVFDAEQPFLPKVFTRLRAIARAASRTQLKVSFFTDGGAPWGVDPILFEGPEGARWSQAQWSVARWLHIGPLEVQTITPAERPRGLSVEVLLDHVDPTDVQLRDFEILFLPTGRKVRYLGEKVPR